MTRMMRKRRTTNTTMMTMTTMMILVVFSHRKYRLIGRSGLPGSGVESSAGRSAIKQCKEYFNTVILKISALLLRTC